MPIEHLEYPRDLRFSKIVEFKEKLSEKLIATHKRATSDGDYTTFLKQFGQFTVAKIDKKEVSGQRYIIEELRNIRQSIRRLERTGSGAGGRVRGEIEVCLGRKKGHDIEEATRIARSHPAVREVIPRDLGPEHQHLTVFLKPEAEIDEPSFLRSVRDGSRMPTVKSSSDKSSSPNGAASSKPD